MIYKIILITLISSVTLAETIPFKIKTTKIITNNRALTANKAKEDNMMGVYMVEEKESVVNIATSKITKAIEEVRAGICRTMKNGHIRMWFAATETGNIIVAETSGEAGIEVQLSCVNGI